MKKLLITGLLLAALIGGGWWAYAHRSTIGTPWAKATPSAPIATPSQSASSDSGKAAIVQLAHALASTDGKTQLNVLAPSMRDAYKTASKDRFVPAGATLTVRPNTLVVAGNMANVDADLKAQSSATTVVLVLVRDSVTGSWQVIDVQNKK